MRTDTLAVAAPPLVTELSWTAVQVIVDNPTTWWLYLPGPRRFVRPGVMGAVIPIPGTSTVNAQWQAPVGYAQPAPIAGQQATLIWLSPGVEAAPSPGVAPVTSQQQNVQASVIAPAGAGVTQHVPIPSGTLAIGFAIRSEAIPGLPGHFYAIPGLVSIIGDQTDIEYLVTTTATSATSVLAVPFDSSDTTVAVNLVAPVTDQSKIDVLAWPIAISVAVRQNPGDNPLAVALMTGSGTIEFLTIDSGLGGGSALLGVSMSNATPAPWQVANGGNGVGTGSIAAGGNLAIVPTPGAGVNTRLFEIELQIIGVANSFCDLQDDTGTPLGWRVDTTQSGERTLRFYGRSIGQHGVRLHNSSAVGTGAINFGSSFNQT